MNIIALDYIERTFPNSKIIVMLQDPRDAMLSSFFQNFRINLMTYHFLTLKGAANFYAPVMRLYTLYRQKLSFNIIEVKYEDLVTDLQGKVKRILNFLGLEWEDSILRYYEQALMKMIYTPSYEQVIKSVYLSSIDRWKNYKCYLEPIMSILEPYIRNFGSRV